MLRPKSYGGGYPGSTSLIRFNLHIDGDDGSGLGTGGGGGPVAESVPDTSARARPEVDLSGLSAEELSAVPDINGGGDQDATPATGQAQTPADPNIAAGRQAPPAQTAAQTQAQTIRDAAQFYGLDLSQFQDDGQAFAHLVRQAQQGQQNDYYAQLGRQLAPRAQQIQQYLAQQAAPAPEPVRPSYLPPEFDERWLSFVDKDEATGVWRAKPGYDPAIAQKVNAYGEWMAGFQRNPFQHIQPAIQAEARTIAEQIVREQFQAQAQQQTIGSIMETNSPWLYQTDANGNRYVDAHGRYIPTPAGGRYQHHVAVLGQAGVRDPRTLDQLAQQLVRSEFAAQQQQQVAPAAPPPTPQQGAGVARPNVNQGQIPNPGARVQHPSATGVDTTGMSLYQILKAELQAGGVTDDDISNSMRDTYGR